MFVLVQNFVLANYRQCIYTNQGFAMFAKNWMMKSLNHRCFVCQVDVTKENSVLNTEVNLPVCNTCRGTDKEKETVAELLDSLADGLVCGCI